MAVPIIDVAKDLSDTVTGLGETATRMLVQKGDIAAAGLDTWRLVPVNYLQNMLELGCVDFGLPWWGSIAALTVVIRVVMLPFVVKVMRNNINMSNIKPQMDAIIASSKAKTEKGDQVGAAKDMQSLKELMKANDCSFGKIFMMPLVQLPVFMSFFFAIRDMAELPIESMKTGGLYWFTDLTVADPYYILPVISCATLLTTIELGSDGMSTRDQPAAMKNYMRGFAVMLLPIAGSFPAGLFVYWITANVFSLSQLLIFKVPFIKRGLNIPDRKPLPLSAAPTMGFMDSFNTSMAASNPSLAETPEKKRVSHAMGRGPMKRSTKRK